jgi:hypothetical protein
MAVLQRRLIDPLKNSKTFISRGTHRTRSRPTTPEQMVGGKTYSHGSSTIT